MVHQHLQPCAFTRAGPFQHLAVARGVTEGGIGTLADEQIDPDRLPAWSKNSFGSRISSGLVFLISYFAGATSNELLPQQ